jgi:uncharacterized protein YbjT (DUF2867 family)
MILVTGATGNVGQHLIDELVKSAARVRALIRDRADARAVRRQGAEVCFGSFEDTESLRQALDGVERLFLLSPPGADVMVRQQSGVVDLAADAGVRHVVKQSSIAADEETDAGIVRAHREIERRIEASAPAWTHLRSHWFMQNELGQAGAIAAGQFYAPDVTRITPVDVRDVAAVGARVLTEDGHEGRAYVVTGPEPLSYSEMADVYTRVLGRPVSWVEVTLEDARTSMEASGLPKDLARGFTEIMARYRDGGVTAAVSPDVRELLGREARSFAQFVRDHRATFDADAMGR